MDLSPIPVSRGFGVPRLRAVRYANGGGLRTRQDPSFAITARQTISSSSAKQVSHAYMGA